MTTTESMEPAPKKEVLQARVSAEKKNLIKKAADISGQSLTDFMLINLQNAAEKIIRNHEIIELAAKDSKVFVEAMMNPPPPNEKLKEAAKWYRDLSLE